MTAAPSSTRARAATPAAPAERLLAVVLDHAHARFFIVAGSEVQEVECLVSPRMRGGRFHSDRQGSPGWGEHGFHGRRQEEERRHYATVARRLGVLLRTHGAGGVVIGGSRRVVAEFRAALPQALARTVLGVSLLNPIAVSGDAVRRAARVARQAAERADQRGALAELREGFGSGRAVDGMRPVLQALERNQVRQLLLDQDQVRVGFRGARSGRLLVSKDDAAGEPVVRVPNLVAAMADEARRRGAAVLVVRDRSLAARFDGIAALLRYR